MKLVGMCVRFFVLGVLMFSMAEYAECGEASKSPIDMNKVSQEGKDKQIVREGIMAELDAVNLYEQLAASADNKFVKKVLLDIACEEKTHVGEFQALLLKLDEQQQKEIERGLTEVKEMMKQ